MAAHYPLESPVDTLSALAQTVETAMGGSSGVLFLLGFKAAAGALKQRGITTTESCDTAAWAAAFCAFADAISLHGGAGIGSRTMCDAIIPASEVLRTGGSFVE